MAGRTMSRPGEFTWWIWVVVPPFVGLVVEGEGGRRAWMARATRSRRRFLAASAGLGALAWTTASADLARGAQGGLADPLEAAVSGPDVVVRAGGQVICVYRHTASPRKPYIRELAPWGVENLLLDGPSDHLHHHGLMLAFRVNGVNFWEETAGCGFQKPTGLPEVSAERDAAGQPRVRIEQVLHWVPEADAERADTRSAALLIERRTLAVRAAQPSRAVEIVWRSEIVPGPAGGEPALTGSNYNGLGVRLRRELDPTTTHVVTGLPATGPDDGQTVVPGDWGALRIDAPGHPATLAMAGSTRNPRVPGSVFCMKRPFVYLALTQGLDRAPLNIPAGSRLTLAYRIGVVPRLETAEQIQAGQEAWSSAEGAQG